MGYLHVMEKFKKTNYARCSSYQSSLGSDSISDLYTVVNCKASQSRPPDNDSTYDASSHQTTCTTILNLVVQQRTWFSMILLFLWQLFSDGQESPNSQCSTALQFFTSWSTIHIKNFQLKKSLFSLMLPASLFHHSCFSDICCGRQSGSSFCTNKSSSLWHQFYASLVGNIFLVVTSLNWMCKYSMFLMPQTYLTDS